MDCRVFALQAGHEQRRAAGVEQRLLEGVHEGQLVRERGAVLHGHPGKGRQRLQRHRAAAAVEQHPSEDPAQNPRCLAAAARQQRGAWGCPSPQPAIQTPTQHVVRDHVAVTTGGGACLACAVLAKFLIRRACAGPAQPQMRTRASAPWRAGCRSTGSAKAGAGMAAHSLLLCGEGTKTPAHKRWHGCTGGIYLSGRRRREGGTGGAARDAAIVRSQARGGGTV